MFNKNFYPTPINVIELMGIDCSGKKVLEPSAGKGDIINYLKENNAKEVYSCEINEDLSEIIKQRSKFIKHDFLKVKAEEISHIHMIVANPPFSNGDKHLLHMWEIAPDGCEIICLLNYSNLENDYTRSRKELINIIKTYGTEINLGNVFNEAERKTVNTEIALIKLYKPGSGPSEFDGFFMEEDEDQVQENGIMRFDAIRDIVQRYVYSVKCFEEHLEVSEKMNGLTSLFGVGGFSFNIGYQDTVCTKEDFKKEIQKKAWAYLFKLMNLNKYLTSGVMKEVNKFVENQNNVPFTMKNIYRMFEVIVGTKDQAFTKSLVEAIDNFTKHTHDNRYNVEGWKTNEGHMLNHKFIINWASEYCLYSKKTSLRHGTNMDYLEDIHKVLCSMTATNYDNTVALHTFRNNNRSLETNKWYDWNFFEFKVFKKGSMHLKFKDVKVWEQINRSYAKAKGQVLPEKFRI